MLFERRTTALQIWIKVSQNGSITPLSLSRPLLVVCLFFLCPLVVLTLVFAGGGMASAGRGEIPPKSDPPLCVWFLFDSSIASNASSRLLTSCGVAAPDP